MKKLLILFGCLALVFAFSTQVVAKNDKPDCTTIQDGTLETTDGEVITTGYDEWGYNYQAHIGKVSEFAARHSGTYYAGYH